MKATGAGQLNGTADLSETRKWALAVFLFVLLAQVAVGYYVVVRGNFIMNDGMARTANAYYVLYIHPNKLASMGFIWNPLPSMLQLPILLFANMWRPLATHAFAGSILTAVFAAINAWLLFRYFRFRGCRVWVALLITGLYAFNPFIFYYGLNGMSETMLFTVLISGAYNFAVWIEDRATNRLLVVALMLAMGFLTRYEILSLNLGYATSLLAVVFLTRDPQSPFRKKPLGMKFGYAAATSTVLFMPVLYVIALWMIVCWVIMGDPLFFFGSSYSNEALTATAVSSDLQSSMRDPINVFLYCLFYLIPFIAPLIVILCERAATRRLLKADLLVLILLGGSLVGFHYMLLLTGRSFGWIRFFSYALPLCMGWIPYELPYLGKWARALTCAALCVGLIVSGALIPWYVTEGHAVEENAVLYRSRYNMIHPQMELARIINETDPDAKVLMDSYSTFAGIMTLNRPENVVTNISDDFMDSLRDPHANGIDYIIVPLPKSWGLFDEINRAYPDLFYYGVPFWAERVAGNDWYRLFRVTPKPEEPGEDEDAEETEEREETEDGAL